MQQQWSRQGEDAFLEKKWLKFHYDQYHFKVSFMLHADYDSIVKLIDEQYSEKMNQMKAKRKSKIPYTGKISTHVPSG